MAEPLVVDVVAIEVWRWRRDADVGVGRITASYTSRRDGDLRLLRHGRQWGHLTGVGSASVPPNSLVSPSASVSQADHKP